MRVTALWIVGLLLGTLSVVEAAEPAQRPNILWISCEDTSPDLGCYGDSYAVTPNLDKFAAQGARYSLAFSHAPVCAPSRSGLILGMYPTTVGSHHMRSNVLPHGDWRCFPAYLRDAGYYCTNNAKTDYNFPVPKDAWDDSSNKAHWRNRPNKSQPFFSVFNYTVTHESQNRASKQQYENNTRRLTTEQRHDPSKAKLPSYYPDTPVVRNNWAVCYDNVTAVDYLVADLLAELDADGLADNTVVFFFGDHGRGLTRGKRFLYDTGLRVPLLVRWPGKIKPGTVVDDLTAFVDFGPTVLSIAGVDIPKHMQGQAFLGPQKADKPREYIYAARDRMDERYDMIRAVRDQRYKYIRNYMPWKPYSQHLNYAEAMPILQEWRRLLAAGELTGPAALFMQPSKPVEELYDCVNDPDEINNLAGDPNHRATLDRLRSAHQAWVKQTADLGFVAEIDMLDMIRKSPTDWRSLPRPSGYPPAAAPAVGSVSTLSRQLEDDNFAVALQAALALDELGEKARPALDALKRANERKRENDYVLRVTAHALKQLGVEPTNRAKQ